MQAPRAVLKKIFVSALEIALSSRHLSDVSDDERQVSFLGADQLLGRAVELFGRETFKGLVCSSPLARVTSG